MMGAILVSILMIVISLTALIYFHFEDKKEAARKAKKESEQNS